MTDVYKPTTQESDNISPLKDHFKVSGDQIFATLQGEGLFPEEGGTAGLPAIFLRLHFCNLACSWCDTKYTWDKTRAEFWQESENWTIEETAQKLSNLWDQTEWEAKFGKTGPKRLVVTGGEPLLQQDKIAQLIKILPGWSIEIETNGTVPPSDALLSCQINSSPKLSNSGNLKVLRYKPDVLKRINNWPNSWFKFVVQDETDLTEVEEIVKACKLSKDKVLIMPEGYTLDDVKKHAALVAKAVIKHGWRIGRRNQLTWFGTKRRT